MTPPTPMATGWETVGDWREHYPRMLGPYGLNAVPASALGPFPRSVASVTIPDPGFAWHPYAHAQLEIRTDIIASRPAVWVRAGSATGVTYANGSQPEEAPNRFVLVQAIPKIPTTAAPISAGATDTARTLHLVVHNVYGAGWIETTALNADLTVFVVPA